MSSHSEKNFMLRALALARKGLGTCSPNPAVGSIIVKDGKIVGRGFHKKAGENHAEVNAIKDAGDLAKGATLFVTLEPCSHTGKTPPCVEAILEAGISKVFIAMLDPNPKVSGRGAEILKENGLEVHLGLCQKEAEELNHRWLYAIKNERPHVTLKLALSLDGCIAGQEGKSEWLSSPASRALVQRLRRDTDAILVGAGTLAVDNPKLTNRSGRGKQPLRIVVDSTLRSITGAETFKDLENAPALIATTDQANAEAREAFQSKGIEVLVLEQKNGWVSLDHLFKELYDRGIQSVLCEGGSHVASSLVKDSLADRILLFHCPSVFGEEGIPWFTSFEPGQRLDLNYRPSFTQSVSSDVITCWDKR